MFPWQLSFVVLAHLFEARLRHEARAGTVQALRHFFEAAAAVEFIHSGHDRLALGLCAGVFDGFPERFVWNINSRFYASKIMFSGMLSTPNGRP
jgi:prephenate dehydrogenase